MVSCLFICVCYVMQKKIYTDRPSVLGHLQEGSTNAERAIFALKQERMYFVKKININALTYNSFRD